MMVLAANTSLILSTEGLELVPMGQNFLDYRKDLGASRENI